jgi:hypothetical protein
LSSDLRHCPLGPPPESLALSVPRRAPGVSRIEQALLEHAIALKANRFKQQLADAQIVLDLEYLLIGEVEPEKLAFLQESYWYYLDFQMNVGLALALAVPLLASLCAKGIVAAADTAARSRELTEGNELKNPAGLLRWPRRSRRSLPQLHASGT